MLIRKTKRSVSVLAVTLLLVSALLIAGALRPTGPAQRTAGWSWDRASTDGWTWDDSVTDG